MISMRLEQAKKSNKEAELLCQQCVLVPTRGPIVCFAIAGITDIDPMYQVPLHCDPALCRRIVPPQEMSCEWGARYLAWFPAPFRGGQCIGLFP